MDAIERCEREYCQHHRTARRPSGSRLLLALALQLLLVGVEAVAGPPDPAQYPAPGGLPGPSGTFVFESHDASPTIALLQATAGSHGLAVIGLEWRSAMVSEWTGGYSALHCATAGPCSWALRRDATDCPGSGPGLPCAASSDAFVGIRPDRLTTLLRLAVYTDGAVGWHRLDTSCRGNSADRCSMLAVVFGIHGASASMQWREDGARALIARRESTHDAVHIRFQVDYHF